MSKLNKTLINGVFNEAQNLAIAAPYDYSALSVQGVFTDTTPDADTGIVPGVAEVSTLTPDTQANTVNGDQFIVYDRAGLHYSIWLNPTGEGVAPTGALYLSATAQIEVDLTAIGTKEVSTITAEALATLDTGDYFVVHTPGGDSHAVYVAKAGSDAAPTGAVYVAAENKYRIPLHGDYFTGTTAIHVAAELKEVLDATGFATDFTIVDNEDGTLSITCNYAGDTAAAEVHDATDSGAGNFLAATATPGALGGTVASVCDTIITACGSTLDGIFTLADNTTNVGFTAVIEGATTNAVAKDEDEDAAGTITAATTAAGVDGASAGGDDFYVSAHTYETGTIVQLSTTGTLPAGLATVTDYYIIDKSADRIQFATTLANAKAGTAIDITDTGTGNSTVTATALDSVSATLQHSDDGTNWLATSSTQTIDAPDNNADDFIWEVATRGAQRYRVALAHTKGQLTARITAFAY